MCLPDAFERWVAGNLAAGNRAVGGDREPVTAAGGNYLALIEEGMHFDLVGDERFGREDKSMRNEQQLLISCIRRIGQLTPKGVSVKAYYCQTKCTATVGIELEEEVLDCPK